MAKKSLKPKEEEATIDMTPMLDIVFIMLIFFIVTTSFVKEAGVGDIMKPKASTSMEKPKANIFVGINQAGEIYMLKRIVKKEDVGAMIENMLLENPESSVVIQADMRSNSGILIDVLDAAKKAGVENISVAAEN